MVKIPKPIASWLANCGLQEIIPRIIPSFPPWFPQGSCITFKGHKISAFLVNLHKSSEKSSHRIGWEHCNIKSHWPMIIGSKTPHCHEQNAGGELQRIPAAGRSGLHASKPLRITGPWRDSGHYLEGSWLGGSIKLGTPKLDGSC